MDREPHWAFSQRQIDFYDIKGCIEDLLEALQIDGAKFERAEDIPYLHPGKASAIIFKEERLGVFGEVHPEVLSKYEISGKAFIFEIDFDKMVKWAKQERRFQPLPKFPAVYRDLSLVINEDLEAERVKEVIMNLNEPFIDEIKVFDLYKGAPIPEGKKGVSYRIRYQAKDRTLTDEEVNRYHENVISKLREILNAELRQ